jgi:hypothetical protein
VRYTLGTVGLVHCGCQGDDDGRWAAFVYTRIRRWAIMPARSQPVVCRILATRSVLTTLRTDHGEIGEVLVLPPVSAEEVLLRYVVFSVDVHLISPPNGLQEMLPNRA